jgi:hypothetical protein
VRLDMLQRVRTVQPIVAPVVAPIVVPVVAPAVVPAAMQQRVIAGSWGMPRSDVVINPMNTTSAPPPHHPGPKATRQPLVITNYSKRATHRRSAR